MPEAAYDAIAEDYRKSKELPFRIYAEAPLLLTLVGDVRGKTVLDLACGEGIYARKLMCLGASKVVGIDLSAEMVALARASETASPLGIDYLVGDAASIGKVGAFDLVLGSYLLNYARSAEQLDAFCRTITANLAVGGRFVGMNDNPANDPSRYQSYRKYGFVKTASTPRREGDPITYTRFDADGAAFSFDNYYLAMSTYERIMSSHFREFYWRRPVVTPEGRAAMPEQYWREFEADAPVIGIEARV